MPAVGIIANPASGKDIRRLVALGSVFGNQEKVNIIRRILVGLDRSGIDHIYLMPDVFGIGWHAVDGLGRANKHIAEKVTILDMRIDNDASDSSHAAEIMRELGVTCFITLGGDGTNRVVAKGSGDVPIVPLSTGTNNVLPYMMEGTIAGLTAGFVARHVEDRQHLAYRSKRLDIHRNGKLVDMALVDVAVVSGTTNVGTRAVWEPGPLRQIIVTRGSPETTGMSALVGFFHPISPKEAKGMSIMLDEQAGLKVTAPLAPGVIVTVGVKKAQILNIGDKVAVERGPGILALDGEREVPLNGRDTVEIELSADGPWIVDVHDAMRFAVANGAFSSDGAGSPEV
jgi:predicted polyphosphate/ATP-dependent NAD kinase